MYNLSFFGQFFLQTFLLYNWILPKKNFNFCKFADSKSGAQELSNDLSNMGFILIRKKSLGEYLIFLAYSAWIGMIFLIGKNAFLKTCSAN